MATTTQGAAAASAAVSSAVADASAPANVAPATEFSTSGAPVQVVSDVDPSHPAVDNDPRAGTTIAQNRIAFNDPTISGADAVAKALGMKDQAQADKEAAKAAKQPQPDADTAKA